MAPYRRSLRLAHGAGVATLEAAEDGVAVTLDLDDARDEAEALDQLAFVLDLDAPAAEIAEVLGRDAALGFTPGLRVPGGEGVEIAVRAVLTQQISVKAGRTHAGRLVAAAGEPLARPRGSITHLFPTAEAIAAAPDSAFAMPARRRETLRSLAGADLHDLDRAARHRAVDAGLREHARARATATPGSAPTSSCVKRSPRSVRSTPTRGARSAPTPPSTSGTRWARARRRGGSTRA